MKKGLKILIASSLSLLTIGILITAIINFIILPPKVTGKAQKYRYNHNNILKLKSITVDGDRVIYEFSSLNKFFTKKYVEKNRKEREASTYYIPFIELYKSEKDQIIKESIVETDDYSVISTLTSNYLIVYLGNAKDTNCIRCFFLGHRSENEMYDYLHISVNSNGYDNPVVNYVYDDTLENHTVGKYQTYDKEKKKWSEIEEWSDYFSHVVNNNRDSIIILYNAICSLR